MKPRPATAEECDRLWPAVNAENLVQSRQELRAYRASNPWAVRVAGRGEAALLGPWRLHLDVLAIRGMWVIKHHVTDFALDALSVATESGFGRVLSPLLPVHSLDSFHDAGMRDLIPIVAIQGVPERMRHAVSPNGVTLRAARQEDCDVVSRLDAECFDDFWRYSTGELAALVSRERCMLAETADGELIGYTLATAHRGAAVLSRLCTAPHVRRSGVGAFLLSDVGAWCRQTGAVTIALCTQEENAASRALYASAGLVEIADRYAFALREI